MASGNPGSGGGCGTLFAFGAIFIVVSCFGSASCPSQQPAYQGNTVTSRPRSPEDDELRRLPSLSRFNESEKDTIIKAAKDFDARVRELESRRSR